MIELSRDGLYRQDVSKNDNNINNIAAAAETFVMVTFRQNYALHWREGIADTKYPKLTMKQ